MNATELLAPQLMLELRRSQAFGQFPVPHLNRAGLAPQPAERIANEHQAATQASAPEIPAAHKGCFLICLCVPGGKIDFLFIDELDILILTPSWLMIQDRHCFCLHLFGSLIPAPY